MHLTAPRAVSKSFSPWRVVSDGDAALLLPAMARGAPLVLGVFLGDASAPTDSRSGPWPALLAAGVYPLPR